MSPRGVAIPDLRERLFGAAERIVAREGAAGLTSRAVTGEAGCAKGVLHTHFGGVDEFVAELVLDRFARAAAAAEGLAERAGQDGVAANLAAVALGLLDALDPGIVGLAMSSHATSRRIREALAAGAPGFAAIQDELTAYLDAELRLGRLPDGTDTATTALALVATVHHLLMTGGWAGAPDPREQTGRLIALLLPR
ncbi:TetR/AcrR family transcriptional regulator [Streptomyces sp. NPDC058284]|uniref:TetR/AcrR family transcriptional regulator n=1 Tax=unclassified Streptomyces TaxID=2593676 RepID=UPI00364E4B4F